MNQVKNIKPQTKDKREEEKQINQEMFT